MPGRLYNSTGKSVFAVALFHATLNLSWMLFPVYGSHFERRLGGLLMMITAAFVTMVWGAPRVWLDSRTTDRAH